MNSSHTLTSINQTRIKKGNTAHIPTNGKSVIYLMSRDQRVEHNHALYEAQQKAISLKLPLIVVFLLYPHVKNRQRAHYTFMFDGLKEVELTLRSLSIPLVVLTGDKWSSLESVVKKHKAASVYFDFSPLRGPSKFLSQVARKLAVPCYVVDTHNIVPVWIASPKQEWSAFTFRKKLTPLLPGYLLPVESIITHPYPLLLPQVNWHDVFKAVDTPYNHAYLQTYTGGRKEALSRLKAFIQNIASYSASRNNPILDAQSQLSPYLHFGQISSLEVVLAVQSYIKNVRKDAQANNLIRSSADSFLEEIIIRKELSDNFCFYNQSYDSFKGIPEWAKKTLHKHVSDHRPHLYTFDELEQGKTEDEAWNAAQSQLLTTGKMHGYMRMYWAKKLLEWTSNAQRAIEYAVTLNDRYSIDGYDPNGYVGILWSIGGLHDRPWPERNIYGTVRTMTQEGLRRKFPLDTYIQQYLKKTDE